MHFILFCSGSDRSPARDWAVGSQCLLRHLHRKTSYIALSAVFLTGQLLASCQTRAVPSDRAPKESSQSAAEGSPSSTSAVLPSMSSYVLEQMGGAPVGHSTGADQTIGLPLAAGEYCFHKAGAKNWLSIRLVLTGEQQLSGESAGTVRHPQKGETRYQQSFTGELIGNQVLVDVTTQIAGVSKTRQETWVLEPAQLDMGRVVIEQAPCLEVSTRF